MSENVEFIAAKDLPVLEAEQIDVLGVDPATGQVGRKPGASVGTGGATPDFHAAEGEPGHILNRTHYPKEGTTEEETIAIWYVYFTDGMCNVPFCFPAQLGKRYTIYWDSVEYQCEIRELTVDGATLPYLGNAAAFGGEDTGEPFLIVIDPVYGESALVDYGQEKEKFTVRIVTDVTRGQYETIPPEYLPDAVDASPMVLLAHGGHKMDEALNALRKGMSVGDSSYKLLDIRKTITDYNTYFTLSSGRSCEIEGSFYRVPPDTNIPVLERGYKVSEQGLAIQKTGLEPISLEFTDSGLPYTKYGITTVWQANRIKSPSGKVFEITVDDSGNLSASEVTT